MDKNININNPQDSKCPTEKVIPDVGVQTETSSHTGLTSVSNDRADLGRVTRGSINSAARKAGDGRDKIVNTKEEGAAGGTEQPSSQAAEASVSVTRSENLPERQEEDIEVDEDDDPPASGVVVNSSGNGGNFDGDNNNTSQGTVIPLKELDKERKEEDIEIDEPSKDIPPESCTEDQKVLETKSEGESASEDQEECIDVDTNELKDVGETELKEKNILNAEPIAKGASVKGEASQSDKEIEDDDTQVLKVENDSTDETQEYSMKNDGRKFVDYQDEDFNTDSDFENAGDDDNQRAELEKRPESTKNMGQAVGKKGGKSPGKEGKGREVEKQEKGATSRRDKTRASPRKKAKSSSSDEDDGRPWLDDPWDREMGQRKKQGRNMKPSAYRTSGIARLKRQWSDHDTKMYRKGYPGKKDDPNQDLNLRFYRNQVPSRPNGALIDDIHQDWWNDLDLLESHHGYIQWLFPIRESGMNWHAKELQRHEAEKIQKDRKAFERFVKSYEMMLNFYGLRLASRDNGEVERAENWKPRFRHLNCSMHNYLRITRILKCLGEMGLERYKAPFLRHMLREAIVEDTLDRTLESCYNYWIGTLRDDEERKSIEKYAEELYDSNFSSLAHWHATVAQVRDYEGILFAFVLHTAALSVGTASEDLSDCNRFSTFPLCVFAEAGLISGKALQPEDNRCLPQGTVNA
ncbi:hypothetical protein BaRGS_00031836 [Batillaria attramentaria]|uniref:Opioid growth factor receptor (OGFr) conserved domain-containing protein n=1 Tax=Batillaria attramentaria TaxID=370345 RepID=A0ABD0JQV6_9CAEN